MQYLKQFEDYLKMLNYRQSTITHYKRQLQKLNSYSLKATSKDLDTITSKDYIIVLNSLKDEYANNSINNFTSILKQYYNYLVSFEDYKINIVLDSMFVKSELAEIHYISENELFNILEFADSSISRVSILIMYCSGLRIAELENLQRNQIQIQKNYKDEIQTYKIYFDLRNTKNRYPRLVPFFAVSESFNDEKAIEYYLKNQSYEIAKNDFPFASVRFRIYRILKRYNEENNKDFTMHDFRRSFATNRAREGIRLDLIAKLMGHQSITTTLRYIFESESEIKELI